MRGMHVVGTRETGPGEVVLVEGGSVDQCLRVGFAASEGIDVKLVDASGTTLAASRERASGLLGPDGPVCIRKGAALRATTAGRPGVRVRWILWSARP